MVRQDSAVCKQATASFFSRHCRLQLEARRWLHYLMRLSCCCCCSCCYRDDGDYAVAAQGCLPHGENVFVPPAIRSPIDILMVTTMALVWTVNSTLSWGCNYVMQRNLGWSVATGKKKTAAHTFCTCPCSNKVMSPIRQKQPNFRIQYFCPSKCRRMHSAARGGIPSSPLDVR